MQRKNIKMTNELYKMLKIKQKLSPDKKIYISRFGIFSYNTYIKDVNLRYDREFNEIIIYNSQNKIIINLNGTDKEFLTLSDYVFFNYATKICIEVA